jgi:hypothetical protein
VSYRARLDQLRELRQRGHTLDCASNTVYSGRSCQCPVTLWLPQRLDDSDDDSPDGKDDQGRP